jgi:hypothetical protein
MIGRSALLAQEDEEQLPLGRQGQRLLNSTELLVPIQQVLSSEGVEDPGRRIAMRILEAFARAANGNHSQSAGRFSEANLPVPQQENVSKVDSATDESTTRTILVSSPGRFPDSNLLSESDQLNDGEVDSAGVAPTFASADKEACSRPAAKNLPLCDQGDTNMGDSFHTNVTFNDYHKYISLMMKNVTLREQFQQFIASILEGDAMQWRRYNPLLEEECSLNNPLEPEAITAALLETLVLYYPNKSLKKPGGYFTKHSRTYRSGIPAYARDLMKMYGHMTYKDLVSRLQAGAIQRRVRAFFPSRANLHHGHALPPYGSSRGHTGMQGSGQARVEQQGQMSEIEAKSLEVQIRWEASFVQIHGIRRVSQSAYVIDVSINGVPWVVASKQDWDRYSDELRVCEARAGQAAN